jgi:hypothetical protein
VAHFHHGQWAWWGDRESFGDLPDSFLNELVELEDPDHYDLFGQEDNNEA